MISGDVLSLSKLTVVRFLQFENAPSPIAITLGGIVISFKSQPKKAFSPMYDKFIGKLTSDNSLQLLNAFFRLFLNCQVNESILYYTQNFLLQILLRV